MVSNYFTLSGLAREWSDVLAGAVIRDIYSPQKDELAIELRAGDDAQGIRICVSAGFHFIFRALRTGRPRSNVTTLFEGIIGRRIESVEMNPTDRILVFRLFESQRLEVHLYGSRANVLLVNEAGGLDRIESAFKRSDRLEGEPPPVPKPLPDAGLEEALARPADRETLTRRLSRLRPRLGGPYIREWTHRAGLDGEMTGAPAGREIRVLEHALESIMSDLEAPSAARYEADGREIFSVIPLRHLGTAPAETFASVDEGVRRTVRRVAGARRLENVRKPLLKALERARDKSRKKVLGLERAARSESRADEYERWGHLLMASPQAEIADETLNVPDLLSDGTEIAIPVEPDLTAVENAERYYEKARSLRTERATLDERLREARSGLEELEDLLQEAAAAADVDEIERFRKSRADALRRLIGGRSEASPDPEPFRRFRVDGFDVWVGRNAKENDRLTFDHASPHDLWFHARGVGGSHVVLRVPGRKAVVGKVTRLKAAAIAAWFSSARGSGLVPVIVTRRKYVSKPKGSDPGAVRVHREEVLMVEPALP